MRARASSTKAAVCLGTAGLVATAMSRGLAEGDQGCGEWAMLTVCVVLTAGILRVLLTRRPAQTHHRRNPSLYIPLATPSTTAATTAPASNAAPASFSAATSTARKFQPSPSSVEPASFRARNSRPFGKQSNRRSRQNVPLPLRDAYSDLGVSKNASAAEIKKAYRKKAMTEHPDKGGDPKEFSKINKAYDILKDEEKRKKYDMFGDAGFKNSGGYGPGGPGGPFGQQGVEVDIGDIFEQFFQGGGGGGSPFGGGGASPFGGFGGGGPQQRQPSNRGADLETTVTVDFRTSVFGGVSAIRMTRERQCPLCGGDGAKPGSKRTQCKTCRGQGQVLQAQQTPFGTFSIQTTCPKCDGEGTEVEEYCPKCSGKGLLQVQDEIKITIPTSISDGDQLRASGQGGGAKKGGKSGDLLVTLKVEPDRKFERKGADIYSKESISYIDAILGVSKEVETVHGNVKINIPAGTQPGTTFRVRGSGAAKRTGGDVKSADNRGNHMINVQVDIPKKVSQKERDMLEQMRG